MRHETPELVEVKMDAEVGSCQSDFDSRPAQAERGGAPRIEQALQAGV